MNFERQEEALSKNNNLEPPFDSLNLLQDIVQAGRQGAKEGLSQEAAKEIFKQLNERKIQDSPAGGGQETDSGKPIQSPDPNQIEHPKALDETPQPPYNQELPF